MPPSPADTAAALLTRRALPVMEACALSVGARVLLDFGPVPLPSGGSLPVRRLREQEAASSAERHAAAAISCFGMSVLAEEKRSRLLMRLMSHAGHTVFLDFKMPERNIEWPAVLLFTALRRSLSRGRPEERGGLEGLLYRERARFTVLSRHTLLGGALCCLLVRNGA